MGNFYRLKNMNAARMNGRVIQTLNPQEADYMEPITEAEYREARAKELTATEAEATS